MAVTDVLPRDDAEIRGFLADLGIPGIVDVHVHFLPERMQRKVWAVFDGLEPPWPVTYRTSEEERLATLRSIGVVAHTALAYAHRPGMAAWLNEHTLALAAHHGQVVPTFTFYPEDDVDEYVAAALHAGGRCAKIHLQVGKFAATDPRLEGVWSELERRRIPIVLHAGAVADGSGGEEFCGPRPVARLLERYPELRLILAHAGAPDFAAFLDLAEAADGLLIDTAMVFTDPPYLGEPDPDLMGRYLALADRFVFGSDFPTIPHPVAAQVRGVAQIGFGRDELRALFWDRPRAVLGVDAPPADA